jgi:integrase
MVSTHVIRQHADGVAATFAAAVDGDSAADDDDDPDGSALVAC